MREREHKRVRKLKERKKKGRDSRKKAKREKRGKIEKRSYLRYYIVISFSGKLNQVAILRLKLSLGYCHF